MFEEKLYFPLLEFITDLEKRSLTVVIIHIMDVIIKWDYHLHQTPSGENFVREETSASLKKVRNLFVQI